MICSPSVTFVNLESEKFVIPFIMEKESSLCLVDGWIGTRCGHVCELMVATISFVSTITKDVQSYFTRVMPFLMTQKGFLYPLLLLILLVLFASHWPPATSARGASV